ncbi:MBL fold metallo-hydrolase [Peptoniphilus sp. oral taxon 386]|uniref:MBL fold metallo-hydrolase n=1 Tax=Peptoniphilus sp. oral taxon 386 TaxID=652713 RepID=UPI0001DA9CD6|nr:MBL fold metallo-hydrolase [Peptoniphilus sp. oral taxon 386]EFI42250.1 metallo-beta-lactamase domain protein [Peptoniphilus sp. oral taxon 386 str. F0131]
MDFKIIRLTLGAYQTNCYIIFDKNNNSVIIDPGAEAKAIIKEIEDRNLTVDKIILTHAHPDHFGALDDVRKHFNVKAFLGRDDNIMLEDRSSELNLVLGLKPNKISADVLVEDGDLISFGDKYFKVISTPGHTPGGICLLIGNVLFSGDTLFCGSIGRTDLPGGDYETILESLKLLVQLPDNTIVLPGHGPESSIEYEKQNNPFIRSMRND